MKFQFYAFLCFVLLASTGRWGQTSNAFIFSLTNSGSLVPFMSKPTSTGQAIDRHSYYGPKFGQDLIINLLNDGGIQNSKALLKDAYFVPPPKQVLAGTPLFLPDEVEVFYRDPSP